MPSVLVTGGLGFIGAGYVNLLHASRPAGWHIVVLDACFYAANEARLTREVREDPTVHIIQCNLLSWSRILVELHRLEVREVVHFAAYSHVGTSFLNPLEFSVDNLLGTQTLLECCRLYGKVERFVMVSTDEVYGESAAGPEALPFGEEAPLKPTNPYAASKAAAEIMASTYARCYGMPVIVSRGNNVLGPGQHLEKLVPAVIARFAAGERARVEGDGSQLRSFLYVQDVAHAVDTLRLHGAPGETYNIGSRSEHSVLEVVRTILDVMRPGAELEKWVEFAPDRPYQDRRYYVTSAKLEALGWSQTVTLREAVERVVCASASSARPSPSPSPTEREAGGEAGLVVGGI